MHPALRKGPLFYKKTHPHLPLFFQNTDIFHFFYKKTPPPHFISCLQAWRGSVFHDSYTYFRRTNKHVLKVCMIMSAFHTHHLLRWLMFYYFYILVTNL